MLKNDRNVTIAIGANRCSKNWINTTMLISGLWGKFRKPIKSTEAIQTYIALPKHIQDDLKDVGGFIGGKLNGCRRTANNVIFRDIITLDLVNIPSEQYSKISTTITKGTITSLSTVANSGYGFMSVVALNDNDASATLLSPNKVFIAHRGDNHHLYGLVCLINNMIISPGIDTLLRNVSSFRISPIALNNNYVFIAHCSGDIGNLYYTTCAIDNTTITTTTIAKQSDYSYFYGLSVVCYTDNNMIVIYANSKLYGRLVGGYAVAGATVDVYVPNILKIRSENRCIF